MDAVEFLKQKGRTTQKNYAQDFFEKFPKAPVVGTEKFPAACRNHIYGNGVRCHAKHCKECWNEPMPEDVK